MFDDFLHQLVSGGSMLESTGSHGRGVERRVPEMNAIDYFFGINEVLMLKTSIEV